MSKENSIPTLNGKSKIHLLELIKLCIHTCPSGIMNTEWLTSCHADITGAKQIKLSTLEQRYCVQEMKIYFLIILTTPLPFPKIQQKEVIFSHVLG